jgi:glyoxylase-like metal-dependent hydrolase (beta-lactamase superfamily II)
VDVTDDDPQADWTAPGVFRCAPGVHRIPLPLPNDALRAVNVYAVADGHGWSLIDAGWAIDEARDLITAALGALGAGLADVRRFLVTHAHRDHYTQAVVLRREFGVRVALGRGEQPSLARISDPQARSGEIHRARLHRAGAHDLVDQLARTPLPRADPGHWEAPDDWLDDGAEIVLGDPGRARTLRAVATPGHTRGHLVFADDTAGLLFAGDHVLPRITPSIGFEAAPPPSPLGDFLDSLHLIRRRPDAALLPAHGPVGMRVHERVDALLAHHGGRLDATLAAVREGRHTAHEVAGVLLWTRRGHALADLDLFNAMLAVLETAAHLDVLVARGALTVRVEDAVAYYAE